MATKTSLKKCISILSVSIAITPTIYFVKCNSAKFLRIIFKLRNGGVAKIFQRVGGGGGGLGSHYVKPRLLMACRHPSRVLLNETFFFG